MSMTPPYVSHLVTLGGICADDLQIRVDHINTAIYLELEKDHQVHFRIDLAYPETLGRDINGLRALAGLADQMANQIDEFAETGKLPES